VIFENSLGKVTMSNFHHPRAVIDINQKSDETGKIANTVLLDHIEGIDDDDDKQKEKKNICTILFEIEKVFEFYFYHFNP
jgi:hypothetical protein